jgi:hypothetical protein
VDNRKKTLAQILNYINKHKDLMHAKCFKSFIGDNHFKAEDPSSSVSVVGSIFSWFSPYKKHFAELENTHL